MTFRPAQALAALAALAAASAGCGDASTGGAQRLEQALAQSAGQVDQGTVFSPIAVPLSEASPHRLRVRASLRLTVAGETRELRLRRTVDRGEGGRFRVVASRQMIHPGGNDDGAEEGREGVFDGARFATRRRFAPWVERETMGQDELRFLRDACALAPGLLRAFGDYLALREDPTSDEILAGRAVRWAAVGLDPRVAPKALDRDALTALRDHVDHWPAWVAATHRPTEASGAIARDIETGQVVAGQLEVSGEANVDGAVGAFVFRVSHAVEALPKGASFALPQGVMAARRRRPWRMIREVMGDDLAPAYR